MNNLHSLKQALEIQVPALVRNKNHVAVLKLLSGYEEPEVIRMCAMCKSYIKTSYCVEVFTNCDQHNNTNGFANEENHEEEQEYERDYDLELKDAEVMEEIYD